MTAMESIVRPFLVVESAPLNRLAPDPEPAVLPESSIAWGAGSRFILPPGSFEPPPDTIGDWEDPISEEELEDAGGVPAGTPITKVISPIPETDFGDDETRVLTEMARVTSVVRVENPEDPTQWVDVERIDVMMMQDSKGLLWRFQFRNPG